MRLLFSASIPSKVPDGLAQAKKYTQYKAMVELGVVLVPGQTYRVLVTERVVPADIRQGFRPEDVYQYIIDVDPIKEV